MILNFSKVAEEANVYIAFNAREKKRQLTTIQFEKRTQNDV